MYIIVMIVKCNCETCEIASCGERHYEDGPPIEAFFDEDAERERANDYRAWLNDVDPHM
jgi:hypothetical protein